MKIFIIFFILVASLFAKDPIKIVYNSGTEPLKFTNTHNKADGLLIDVWKLWAKKNNQEVVFIEASWDDTFEMIKDGRADIHGGLYFTNDRVAYLDYTQKPLYKNKNYFFYHKSVAPITSNEEIFPFVIGVGNGYPRTFMKDHYPNASIKYYDSDKEAIEALQKSEVKVILNALPIFTYTIKTKKLDPDQFHFIEEQPAFAKEYFGAVKKGNNQLLDLINKGFENITKEELQTLENKWVNDLDPTLFENKTLQNNFATNNKNITLRYVYDPIWQPFEFKDELNQHAGIIHEVLELVSKRSGITFKQIASESWSESVELFKNKKADMFSGLSITDDRKEFVKFGKMSIFRSPIVIVTKNENRNDYLDGVNAISDKKVGLVKGYSITEDLQKRFPKKQFVLVQSIEEGLKKLSNNEIDAFFMNFTTAKYYINRFNYGDLSIASKSGYFMDLKIGVQKDTPDEIVALLDKALESITPEEFEQIASEWTKPKTIETTDWSLLFQIVGFGLLIIGFVVYNNKKLKQKVNEQTFELRNLLGSFDKNVIASKTDQKGNITYVSEALCDISGYTQKELIGKSHNILRHQDMPKELFIDLWASITTNQIWRGEIKNRKKNGEYYWVDTVITPEYDPHGKLIGYSAIRQDITAKKEVEELSRSLEEKVKERTLELANQTNFINAVMDTQQNFVLTSDGKCLKTANKAFFDFYGIENVEQFIARFGDCICDTFDTTASSEFIQKYMGEETWLDYVYARPTQIHKAMIEKDGIKFIFTITTEKINLNGEELKTAVFTDITELENTREEIEKILANILLPVLITSQKERKILYANRYAQIQYEKPVEEIIGSDIDSVYTIDGQHFHIIDAIKKFGKVENIEERFKTSTGKEFIALLSVTPITYQNQDAYIGMVTDITKQKNVEAEIRALHRHTKESIEYAALIQHALIPSDDLFGKYFSDYLTIWEPKDIVGGDIYLFEELRNQDECLLMMVDCTGHGVPGAFVTMLVKAIERQIVSNIIYGEDEVSPASILAYFNKTMKHLLKQEDDESISNAGFDGGVIYYNKKESILKFAGGETPLFYIDNGTLKIIKGDRHSIGYKKSKADFVFQEHTIKVEKGMKFYLTTDGYIDQNGGQKGFSFGKSRFGELLLSSDHHKMTDTKKILLENLLAYQNDEERNDDIAIVGFEI